uniref:Uncharacterized protein n=1 Tax=Graphocephala atropunctata TaxID=36148 RepID=A0A1B6KIZ3_9HEMI
MAEAGKIVKKIIEGLKTLANSRFESNADCLKISSTAEDLLFTVYKAGVSNTAYTFEEKLIIGPLIPPALQGLGYKLSTLQSSFSSHSVDAMRIQRSGLQFFIDIFKDFPSSSEKSETLEDTLKEFVEREDLDGLDECLRTAEFDSYTDDSERSAGLQAEIAKLPSTHWWFAGEASH